MDPLQPPQSSQKRLPIPGEDDGQWGDILNEYLLVSLNTNGTLKAAPIIAAKADKTYVDTALQTKPDNSTLSTVALSGSYNDLTDKPSALDTSAFVQRTGNETIAGTKNFTGALQSNSHAVVVDTDTRLSDTRTPSDDSVSSAKLQDNSVVSAKIATTNTPSNGTVLSWQGSSMSWQTPSSAPVSQVNGKTGAVTVTKADVGLANADNTSDENKPVSTATQTALQAKANSADLSTVATSGAYADLTGKPTVPDGSTLVHIGGSETITGAKDFTGGLKASGHDVIVDTDTRLTNTRTPSDNSVSTAKLQDDSVTVDKLATSAAPANNNVLSWNGSALEWHALQNAPVTDVNGKTGNVTVTKADVGLGNADNTSDENKPVSSATQTALDARLARTGGTMSGALTLSGTPTNANHAATKQYVDDQLGGSQKLVIGTTEPSPAHSQQVLWVDTSGGNLTLNLVTGD